MKYLFAILCIIACVLAYSNYTLRTRVDVLERKVYIIENGDYLLHQFDGCTNNCQEGREI